MRDIGYPGMRGPEELVGEYYLNEGARIVSRGQARLHPTKNGHIQLRDSKTGRFVSRKKVLENVTKTVY